MTLCFPQLHYNSEIFQSSDLVSGFLIGMCSVTHTQTYTWSVYLVTRDARWLQGKKRHSTLTS